MLFLNSNSNTDIPCHYHGGIYLSCPSSVVHGWCRTRRTVLWYWSGWRYGMATTHQQHPQTYNSYNS